MVGSSCEGVKDSPDRTAETPELLNDVGLAITAVYDHGFPVLMGQDQVTIEPLLLHGKRRDVPVSIQPGFTDRHDPGAGSQSDDA